MKHQCSSCKKEINPNEVIHPDQFLPYVVVCSQECEAEYNDGGDDSFDW